MRLIYETLIGAATYRPDDQLGAIMLERSGGHLRNFPVSSAQRPGIAAPWRISGELRRHHRAPGGHPHDYQGVCRGPVSGGPASSLPGPPLNSISYIHIPYFTK